MCKKVCSILLLFVLTVGIGLSGCGTQENSGETMTTVADSTIETASADPQFSIPWTGDPIEISYMGIDFRTAEKTFDGLVDQELAKRFGNIKIRYDYVPEADYSTKLTTLFAAGGFSDMVETYKRPEEIVEKYAENGFFLDFSPYLQYMPNYTEQAKKYLLTLLGVDDKIYCVTPCYGASQYFWAMGINEYYVNKYGIKVPTTSDELLDTLRQVKKINPDSIPYTCFPGGRVFVMLNQVFLGCGSDEFSESGIDVVFDILGTQKWYYPLYTPAAKDMVEFAHILYEEGLLAPDYNTQPWDKYVKTANTGDAWFINGDWLSLSYKAMQDIKKVTPEFEYNYILPQTSKYVTSPIIYPNATEGAPTGAVVVNSNTKNPELVCALIDYLNSEEVDTLVNWGFEGKTFRVVDGEKEFLPTLDIANTEAAGLESPVKDYGLYIDAYRKQFSYMTGSRTEIQAKNQLKMLGEFKSMRAAFEVYPNYAKQYPDRVWTKEPRPITTADENNIISKTLTDANTVIAMNLNNFITGKRPMSEWDQFIEEVKKAGDPQVVVDLFNGKPRNKILADQ